MWWCASLPRAGVVWLALWNRVLCVPYLVVNVTLDYLDVKYNIFTSSKFIEDNKGYVSPEIRRRMNA